MTLVTPTDVGFLWTIPLGMTSLIMACIILGCFVVSSPTKKVAQWPSETETTHLMLRLVMRVRLLTHLTCHIIPYIITLSLRHFSRLPSFLRLVWQSLRCWVWVGKPSMWRQTKHRITSASGWPMCLILNWQLLHIVRPIWPSSTLAIRIFHR